MHTSRLLHIVVLGLLLVGPPTVAPGANCGVASGTSMTAASARWSWPIAAPRVLAGPFIAPPNPYGAGHRGIDLWLDTGAPVFAPEGGVVHFVGVVVDRPVISLEHSGGLISSFEPVASTLTSGQTVVRGQIIGMFSAGGVADASSGHCTAPCLHLGARLHGQYVSPLNFLGGIPHSVLLPTRAIR